MILFILRLTTPLYTYSQFVLFQYEDILFKTVPLDADRYIPYKALLYVWELFTTLLIAVDADINIQALQLLYDCILFMVL